MLPRMSGHSKWNNIKNRKGAADAHKAKVWSQLSKQIRIAVKEGSSGDPKFNPSLRLILDKARAANMTKEKMQRAIDAGLGKRNGQSLQNIVYEGFGPGGVGLMIVATTDNPQRTSAEIKFILSRGGGSLGGPGTAHYLFERINGEEFSPLMPMLLEDEATINQLSDLLEELRNNDDVEDVYYSAHWEGEHDGE